MKKLLLLLLLVATMATAQVGVLELEPLLGRELSEVLLKIDKFGRKTRNFTTNPDLDYVVHNDSLAGSVQVDAIQVYQHFGAPNRDMTFTFHTTPQGHLMYIDSITIEGDRQMLINFYVGFWNTTINVDFNEDGLVARNQYITDKIELRTGEKNTIIITSAKPK